MKYMQKLVRSERFPFLVLMTAALIIGLVTIRNYGESWDELQLYKYAGNSLTAYSTWLRSGEIPFTGDKFENYGPAFVMFSTLAAQSLARIGLPWSATDIHHLFYFLTFLLGAWSLHEICRRWMSATAALGATLLFASQPIFWGHAFINPKDIPLLGFMLLSVHLGLKMHASLFGPQPASAFDALTSAWADSPKSTRRLIVTATLFWLTAILLLFGGTPLWRAWLDSSVRAAANGDATLLTPLIVRVASNLQKVAPELYIQKFFVAFLQARAVFFWLSNLTLLWLYKRFLPSALRVLGIILPASLALGFTSSIRIFGPLAGILVVQHAARNTGKKSILVLVTYALLTVFVMYASWPYLWHDPIGHLIETVTVMSHHPWPGLVLFNGVEYSAQKLPASYMPTLLAIQLTEPVWVLSIAGLAVTVYKSMVKREGSRDLLALTFIWFILPLATFMILRPTLYDNFRQAFFILPMVFALAGITFDQVRTPLVRGLLILTLIAPGMVNVVRLHPYEYAYYNSFAGGMGGAYHKFELDYWGLSYREAAQFINEAAPANGNIWAEGPAHLLDMYLREDLKLYSSYEVERADHYDYVVILVRYDKDLKSYPDAEIVHTVERDGAALTIIKKP